MPKYNDFTADELRKLLLAGELDGEMMTEEDYAVIMDNEYEMGNPNSAVIDFCIEGLNRFEYYNEPIAKTPIDELFRKFTSTNKPPVIIKRRFPKFMKIAVILPAAVIALLLTQMICLALGFDLFGYIFNWNNKDTVEVLGNVIDEQAEPKEETYKSVEDIPNDMRTLISEYLFDNYVFQEAYYKVRQNYITRRVDFISNTDNILFLSIFETEKTYIEKDDDGYYEQYVVGNVEFQISTNMGKYQAMWVYDGKLYHLYTQLELSELKQILSNYYN